MHPWSLRPLAVVVLMPMLNWTAVKTGFSFEIESLDQAGFAALHDQLKPDPSDTWRQIPWRISVLEGQRTAVEDRKPIFIWAMDGHPLGCT